MGNPLKINPVLLILIGFGTCIVIYFFIFSTIHPQINNQKEPDTIYAAYNAPFGKLLLASNISDNLQNVTLYHVTQRENDMIDYWNWGLEYSGNITSATKAPQVAQQILEKYGGIPDDAGPAEAETEYIEEINVSTHQVVDRTPYSTVVNYQRSLDGKPVIGGYIRMELGSDGELHNLKKVWRTVTPAGTIQVISSAEALQKILRGDVLNEPPKCTCDLTVDKITLAYRENGYNQTQDYLEPVWDFKGTLSNGDSYRYLVSAESTRVTSSNSHVMRDYLLTEIPPHELPPDNIQDADNNPNASGITPDNQSNTLLKGNHS